MISEVHAHDIVCFKCREISLCGFVSRPLVGIVDFSGQANRAKSLLFFTKA